MSWIDKLMGAPAEEVVPAIMPVASAGNESMKKIDFHVRRFTLALEQCDKGPERKAELKRNLDYWLARKAAEELRRPE